MEKDMKHKIVLEDWDTQEDFGVNVYVDGKKLFYDGSFTYNCLQEILNELGIDAEVIQTERDLR
jgi:hypothetical protein